MSDFEKTLEKGLAEIGKAIDKCVEKVNDFAKSEKGQTIKREAKSALTDLGRSMKELGKSIKDEIRK